MPIPNMIHFVSIKKHLCSSHLQVVKIFFWHAVANDKKEGKLRGLANRLYLLGAFAFFEIF